MDVAHAALLATMDKDLDYRSCNLSIETAIDAVVKCQGTRTYVVRLKRMVRPEGIWTATEIEIDNQDVPGLIKERGRIL